MVSVQTETWKAIDSEIEEVSGFHWEELALDKLLFQRDLDHEQYLALDNLGRMHVVTARDDGRLVGYAVWFVMPHHLHYKSSGQVALADMYFIKREYRKGGLGVRMFRESERGLRERGVIRAHASCKVHEDHTKMFEMMGWAHTDSTLSKVLVEAK
jgi:GNAT superfamily N-acetyltransferase